jgi:hypothetical protein
MVHRHKRKLEGRKSKLAQFLLRREKKDRRKIIHGPE